MWPSRFLAANQQPDFRSIARFRRRHLAAIEELFVPTVRVCATAGLVKLGRIAIDGTKLRANASRHKAMSYGRMVEQERQLQAEIAALRGQIAGLLAEAEQVDAAEDARRASTVPASHSHVWRQTAAGDTGSAGPTQLHRSRLQDHAHRR